MRFKDRKGRDLDVNSQSDSPNVTALYRGKIVGSFDFEEISNGVIKLIYMNLEEDFLKQGIGTEMLKGALASFKQFEVPKSESAWSSGDGGYLTKEAEAFFASCMKNNISKIDGRTILPLGALLNQNSI